MIKIKNVIHTLEDIANRYGLKILSLDFTDITLISRIGFSFEIFIQIYANVKKEKVKLGLRQLNIPLHWWEGQGEGD